MNTHPFQLAVKRAIDIFTAALILSLLWPIMLCIGLLIRWTMGLPVVYRQQRPGKHGRLFVLYKFRTMDEKRGPDGSLLPDMQRLTSIGRFLRYFSLDELPQFWIVLRGDMSLVGPRPLLVEYMELYTPEQARRHDVKPGITGWVQVNGRNSLTWEDKFDLDNWYVNNWSLLLDMKILLATILKLFRQDGINASDHATMPKFQGSNRPNRNAA